MEHLSEKVRAYLDANNKVYEEELDNTIFLSDLGQGDGAFIEIWTVSGLEKPTDAQLNSLSDQADTFIANTTVDTTRKLAYGKWGDQLDEIFHDIDTWKTRIQKIKDDNPKS